MVTVVSDRQWCIPESCAPGRVSGQHSQRCKCPQGESPSSPGAGSARRGFPPYRNFKDAVRLARRELFKTSVYVDLALVLFSSAFPAGFSMVCLLSQAAGFGLTSVAVIQILQQQRVSGDDPGANTPPRQSVTAVEAPSAKHA